VGPLLSAMDGQVLSRVTSPRPTCRMDRCDQLLNGAYLGAGNEWAAKRFQGSGSGRSVIPSLFPLKVRRVVQLQRGVERSHEPFVRPHQRGLRRPSIDEPDELPVALYPVVAELGELAREFPAVFGAVFFARSCVGRESVRGEPLPPRRSGDIRHRYGWTPRRGRYPSSSGWS
jgi:hypothetical protein